MVTVDPRSSSIPAAGVEVKQGRQVVILVGALVEEEQLAPVEPPSEIEP